MVLLNIVVFLISLSLVIILHELGHFLLAKRAGILCHEFSLGMGPVIWQKKKGETVYSIRAIPIGGYVLMAGEEIDQELVKPGQYVRLRFNDDIVDLIVLDEKSPSYAHLDKVFVESVDLLGKEGKPLAINQYQVARDAHVVIKNREMQIAPHNRRFGAKTLSQRFWAVFGGPAMNFVLALVVFLLVNMIVGTPNLDEPIIGSVADNMPVTGIIEKDDQIIEIEGVTVSSWTDLEDVLSNLTTDRNIDMVLLRDGQEITVSVNPIIYIFSFGIHSAEGTIDEVVIGSVPEGTFAASIGLQEGDKIIRIDQDIISNWTNLIGSVNTLANLPFDENRVIEVEVVRDDSNIVLTNKKAETGPYDQPYTALFLQSQNVDVVQMRIGISPEYHFSIIAAIKGGFKDLASSAMVIFTTIELLFDSSGAGASVGVDDLAGPLGIYQITSQALSQGFVSLLSWVGLLSVNLGIVNLLPIPALDGGRLVFLGYEFVSGRKPNQKVENTLHYVMYIALMGLFIFVTFNDLLRLLQLK
jgi:regulator of sigma E protease